MANENAGQNNGAGNSTENSFLDSLFLYLKERLDSPFLMCFLVAWLIINRDFCFYFYIAEESNKAQALANWDFRADLLGWVLVPYANSFIYPSFYGALAAIAFPPVSYTVTALKYLLSARAKGWALSGKSRFDLQLELSTSEVKLKNLKEDNQQYELKIEYAKSDLSAIEARINKSNMILKNYNYYTLLRFFGSAVKESNEYKENHSKYQLIETNTLKSNCLIEVVFTNTKSEVSNFSGTVAEFLLDPQFCPLEDDMPAVIVEKLIEAQSGVPIHYNYNGMPAGISVTKIRQFVIKEEPII